jgi:CHAT domain
MITIGGVDPPDLLALALSTPASALHQARRVIVEHRDDVSVSYAHQAAGIVFRDFGDLPQAFHHLRAALRAARRAADVEREIDVQATLGVALVMAGRTASGLTQLDAAATHAHGLLLAKVRLRRGNVLSLLGRYDEALTDLRLAMITARRSGDRLWEARALHNRTMTYISLGALNKADADAIAAERLFDEVGQAWESVQASHNRAIVATRRGDIPAALRLLDLAEARYESIGVSQPDLFVDRGHALLAAGLAAEAVATAEQVLDGGGLKPVTQAELSLFCARAAIAAGQPELARARAQAAGALFRAQRRPSWRARARLAEYEARYLAGERSARLAKASSDVAAAADQLPEEEKPLAFLLAARLAHDRDLPADAHLAAAARYRARGSALTRASGWLAVAMRAAVANGSPLRACGRGLDALDEHRMLFGAAEIRAFATLHSRDLATLALDAVIASGSARQLLQWSERVRATSLAEPSVRPSDDGESERELAAVRDSVRRIEEAYASGTSSVIAHQQRDAGEAAVRRRNRHLSGTAGPALRFDADLLLSALGDKQLLTLVENRGMLFAVLARGGRLRRFEIGAVSSVVREINFAQFALRRAAYARSKTVDGDALQQAALGPVAQLLDGPVVVVPPAFLHALPWGLLPALATLPTTVAPSAAMWLRATATSASPVSDHRVLLVAGPELQSQGAEVEQLAAVHRRNTMLGAESAAGQPATIEAALDSMNGAWIAHFAAHGSFRTDSPLFSSLRLDDGALFVHDFDRLRKAPRTVILSACDTGVSAAVGADELLGLVTGLLRVGTAGVVASVVPVNDQATVPFMLTLHRALVAGKSLAEAALAGRLAATGEVVTAATAASFTVWGA